MSKFRLTAMFLNLLLRELVHVELRADQARLLGAPECEAHLVARLDTELRHLQGDLQVRRGARAVVVDSRALGH